MTQERLDLRTMDERAIVPKVSNIRTWVNLRVRTRRPLIPRFIKGLIRTVKQIEDLQQQIIHLESLFLERYLGHLIKVDDIFYEVVDTQTDIPILPSYLTPEPESYHEGASPEPVSPDEIEKWDLFKHTRAAFYTQQQELEPLIRKYHRLSNSILKTKIILGYYNTLTQEVMCNIDVDFIAYENIWLKTVHERANDQSDLYRLMYKAPVIVPLQNVCFDWGQDNPPDFIYLTETTFLRYLFPKSRIIANY